MIEINKKILKHAVIEPNFTLVHTVSKNKRRPYMPQHISTHTSATVNLKMKTKHEQLKDVQLAPNWSPRHWYTAPRWNEIGGCRHQCSQWRASRHWWRRELCGLAATPTSLQWTFSGVSDSLEKKYENTTNNYENERHVAWLMGSGIKVTNVHSLVMC